MNPEDPKFKGIRHRGYRLGKHLAGILRDMGFFKESPNLQLSTDECRPILYQIADQGRLDELESLIAKKEAEIMEQIGHVGDPCKYCGIPMVQAKSGPCPVRKKMVQW